MVTRAQGPGQQRGQGRGDTGLIERERGGEAALVAQQVQRPQPVPQAIAESGVQVLPKPFDFNKLPVLANDLLTRPA